MKKAKQIIGVLLIVSAVLALVYWETTGRNIVTTKKVLVASENISAGDIIESKMLAVVNITPDTIIAGALTPEDIHKVTGKEATQDIVKNQQISELFLRIPIEKVKDERSPYMIKPEWIDNRSSSLRKGDFIKIYNRDGTFYLGEFEVVFVKDAAEKEVTDIFGEGVRSGNAQVDIENRTNSNGIISHLEILTELKEYQKIIQAIDEFDEKLLIVQVKKE